MSDNEFENEFFDNKTFIGKTIRFTNPWSSWVLREKLGDTNDQRDIYIFNQLRGNSSAYGTFRCENLRDPSRRAIIKIIMQIPYHGSEFAIHAERARQADYHPGRHGRQLVDVFLTLTENRCSSSPRLLNKKHDIQDDSGMVPGGYMIYLLLEHLPGIQMGPWFWDKDRATRDRIREATREAWEECVPNKWVPWASHNDLFWDESSNKVYFFSFLDCRDEALAEWSDIEWIRCGQVENYGPLIDWYEAAAGPYDKSQWRM